MARGLSDPATAALVERQMRNWELARAQRRPAPPAKRRGVEDFVCVSRMVGIGDAVATRLGERLGWPVFDKQILDAMAGDDRRLRRIYESLDERDVGWWQEVLNPLIRDGMSRNDYFHRLCRTVVSLARHSPGVFVGRGLDRVLPEELGLRVRLIAPRRWRMERYAEEHDVAPEAARREIARIEGERAAFLRQHHGVEPDDPLRHDLSLRLDRLSAERAVELLLSARSCFRAERSRSRP